MRSTTNPDTLTTILELNMAEMRAIETSIPYQATRAIADKFVEENWPKLKKDRAFMADVKAMAMERSARVISDRLAALLDDSLGGSK